MEEKRKKYPLRLAVANRRDLSLFFTSIWLNFPCQVALFIKILSRVGLQKENKEERREEKELWYVSPWKLKSSIFDDDTPLGAFLLRFPCRHASLIEKKGFDNVITMKLNISWSCIGLFMFTFIHFLTFHCKSEISKISCDIAFSMLLASLREEKCLITW